MTADAVRPRDAVLRTGLAAAGVVILLVACGFAAESTWATTTLWPLPDSRLSYLFIAAILAGSAMPLLLTGATGELAGMVGYATGFGVMYAGMAAHAALLGADPARPALRGFAVACAVLAALLAALLVRGLRTPSADHRRMPGPLRAAFAVEIAVLLVVGGGLLLQIPDTLPWPLSPESSVMYGLAFVGMGTYFAYALLRPAWVNARGQLVGFLAYDVVLVVPFLAGFGAVRPEHLLRLVVATAIVVGSAAIAVYYLFVCRSTRLWPGPSRRGGPRLPTISGTGA